MTRSSRPSKAERSGTSPRIGLLTRQGKLATQVAWLVGSNGLGFAHLEAKDNLLEMAGADLLDLALLEWVAGEPDALDCCAALHGRKDTPALPIIVLTTRMDERVRRSVFDAGADDYVAIPFSDRELASRMLRILARAQPASAIGTLSYGDPVMDLGAGRASLGGNAVRLFPTQFRLLRALLERPEEIVTREDLSGSIYDRPGELDLRTIDAYVRRLRVALGQVRPGDIIRTVREIPAVLAAGYTLRIGT